MGNYNNIASLKNEIIEYAWLYGDGYDFQVNVNENVYLTEVKGI